MKTQEESNKTVQQFLKLINYAHNVDVENLNFSLPTASEKSVENSQRRS